MKYLEEISMIIAASIMMLAVNWNPGIAMFLPLITIGRPSLKSVRMALLLVAVFTALILIQPMAGAAGINLPDELFRLVLLMLFIVMVALLIERVEKVRS
ncbi:hypothetical protein [Methanothermobacter wolfeii]|nr:hypothetical protein [Methanothermobacter wolfeii]UXH32508.1 hypothetical protein N5910_04290 [Methanothermobacter wolfeii]